MNAEIVREALAALHWSPVLCGACGHTYHRCTYCGVGMKSKTCGQDAQCRGHRDEQCSPGCMVTLALAEIARAVHVPAAPQEPTAWSDESFKAALVALLRDEPMANGQYVHELYCNASRAEPVGNSGCSCVIGKRIKSALATLPLAEEGRAHKTNGEKV